MDAVDFMSLVRTRWSGALKTPGAITAPLPEPGGAGELDAAHPGFIAGELRAYFKELTITLGALCRLLPEANTTRATKVSRLLRGRGPCHGSANS